MAKEFPTSAAWKRLFEELHIRRHLEEKGIFPLTARQIHTIAKREPRLMTKFDRRGQRPRILAELGVTILPVSNGEYVLAKGDGYYSLPATEKVVPYDSRKLSAVETIPWREGVTSEPQATDALFMASAIRSFAGDESLLLTIRGKLRSHPFEFDFQTRHRKERIRVSGVQIEIDSGFEGRSVVLLEAKYGTVQDFIIRQLYYPYRHFLATGVTKKILPVFFVYSNRVYSLYEFSFPDPENYQQIKLQRQVHYTLEESAPIPSLATVLEGRRKASPENVPFPQADDLSKVIDVAELLSAGPADKFEVAEKFDVDPRQGDYYGNAAAWVGLANKLGAQFRLTGEGEEFVRKNRTDRLTWLARRVCQMPVFHEAARAFLADHAIDPNRIAHLIEKQSNLIGTTPARRALTVQSWIRWLAQELPG